jgi:predicted  nucleic acid-binding Zn-ribbon protein
MKKTAFAILFLIATNSFAQTTQVALEKEVKSLDSKLKNLNNKNEDLQIEVGSLKLKLEATQEQIDNLESKTESNSTEINTTRKDLGLKITSTESTTNEKITAVDQSVSKSTLYSIIGVLLAVLISGILYFLLNKRQKVDRTDFIEKLSKTKSSLEEGLIKEFGKQTELLESQIKIIENQKTSTQIHLAEIDHTLALRVADEITLIERNISLMDSSVKGLKQLSRSVTKLRDNLLANGYEIPELLGKKYDQGMKVIVVSSIPDENIEKDQEIITKIIKPQVNYQNKMIQTAQIETLKGI